MSTMGNRKLLSILLALLCISAAVHADSHFEGFEGEDDDLDPEESSIDPASLRSPPSQPLTTTAASDPNPQSSDLPNSPPTTTTTTFDFWDDDEFEGIPPPIDHPDLDLHTAAAAATDPKSVDNSSNTTTTATPEGKPKRSFTVEILCGSFLVMFGFNYFTGKRENENIALSWAGQFAAKDSIFEKNFSLLGIGDGGDDSPLLLKEGQTTFKFYASGRRYCQGLLATLELKSRHDLIARIYNMVVPTRDEITFEVYMNDDAMDHVVFALARKKAAKAMHKDLRDLQRFATLLSPPSAAARKWVSDDLAVISESREVASDLITDAVIDQVCCFFTLPFPFLELESES